MKRLVPFPASLWIIVLCLCHGASAFVSREWLDLRHTKRLIIAANRVDAVGTTASSTWASETLGDFRKIQMEGEEDGFVSKMAVPTFAMSTNDSASSTNFVSLDRESTKAAGLEGVLDMGPAFVLRRALSSDICEELIDVCESLGFGDYQAGKNNHGALQLMVTQEMTDAVAEVISQHTDVDEVMKRRKELLRATGGSGNEDEEGLDVRLTFAGLNRRWRVYRYAPGGEETFAPHIDAGFPPSTLSDNGSQLIWDGTSDDEEIVSRLTVLMYLNEDFVGGETNFYEPRAESDPDRPPRLRASVRPRTGSILVFPQAITEEGVEYARQNWPLHEGSPVISGTRPKYVIRSDALFATQREKLQMDDPLWCNDFVVRNTFLPASPALDSAFLSHLSSLYNPHMGVENLGPFLYSLIRFTKPRRIVEIGAGYTSLWILQALKDNDEELRKVRHLQHKDRCKLLDIPWSIHDWVDEFDKEPSSLLCIDNVKHQRQTATGATAVANSLGLGSYMEFLEGDAFELDLEANSVDVLWCDFGVGRRMRDFISGGAWASIRPGGFLVCHSTLTNEGTRNWLEAIRNRRGEDETGIPLGEYVELSFLEPHKRYQNSFSILQKRSGDYAEPIYSQYA